MNFCVSIVAFVFSSSAFASLPIIEQHKIVPLLKSNQATGDYTNAQTYLADAPQGIGARRAWVLPGGRGENVKIVDVESGVEAKHEDLGEFYFLGANPFPGNDHGTAVSGILRGTDDSKGVTGIAHKAAYGFVGFKEGKDYPSGPAYTNGMVKAIRAAVEQLSVGDVIVIEQQIDGPDQAKNTLPEFYIEIFNELKAATNRGIHCVAAAGNGSSDLDSPSYEGAFDLKKRDSGCIVVGAGSATSHERLYFSNYGSRVDAHGFGSGVTTTGYGDLFNGGNTRMYTSTFNGTSSATPIVAGAVAIISSVAKAKGRLLTPVELREALRNTGTPQAGNREKRIGSLPNVVEALKYLKLN